MSQVPPGGGSSTGLITPEAVRAAVSGPKLAPLPYTSNNTYGRCSIRSNQQYFENGPSAEEQLALRKAANNIGIGFLGPIAGGLPAAGRVFGASEAQVEALARQGKDIPSLFGGANGLPNVHKGMKPYSPATHVAEK